MNNQRLPLYAIGAPVAVMYRGKWRYGHTTAIDQTSAPGSILYMIQTDDDQTLEAIHEAFIHLDDIDNNEANLFHDLADLIVAYVERVYKSSGKNVSPVDMAQHSSFVGFCPQQIEACIQYLIRLGVLERF